MADQAAAAGETAPAGLEVVVVTGLSGAGRSTAAKCLEDLGYYVVDNLPPSLLAAMVDLGSHTSGEVTRIAVVPPGAPPACARRRRPPLGPPPLPRARLAARRGRPPAPPPHPRPMSRC